MELQSSLTDGQVRLLTIKDEETLQLKPQTSVERVQRADSQVKY